MPSTSILIIIADRMIAIPLSFNYSLILTATKNLIFGLEKCVSSPADRIKFESK